MTDGPGDARVEHPFTVEGTRCAAWLYRPGVVAGETAAPCVVMAHGFAMTRECRLPVWAEAFAAAGLTVLLFDYRGFGASGGQPRQVVDIAAQRDDWAAAVAHARATPGVDPARVALWGTSFSGGHVLHTAARDDRIAAVVAQVPFTDGPATLFGPQPRGGARPPRRAAAGSRPGAARRLAQAGRALRAAVADTRSRARGGPPVLVPVAGEVGSGAVIAGPGATDALRALVPDGVDWRNAVAAGVVFGVLRDRPGRAASRIRAPLFVAVCAGDRVTPEAPARAAAEAAPLGIWRRYPFGHFAAYLPPGREALIADQVTFLTGHLRP